MEKSLSADIVKFLEKPCVKPYTAVYFHATWCFILYFHYSTVSHTETEAYLGLLQNLKWSSFVTEVKDFQLFTFVTKSSIFDFAVVLDMPLQKELFLFL